MRATPDAWQRAFLLYSPFTHRRTVVPFDSPLRHWFIECMGIELSQLDNLRCKGTGAIAVAHLPLPVAEHIGCTLGLAYISAQSIRHILRDHSDVELIDLVCLPEMVRTGLWIADRPREACVLYDHPLRDLRFKAAIKAVGAGHETYIGTFHRVAPRQTRSILRRGTVLCGSLQEAVGDLAEVAHQVERDGACLEPHKVLRNKDPRFVLRPADCHRVARSYSACACAA